MGRLIEETDLMKLLWGLDDARYELRDAIRKIPELLPTVEAIPKDQYEARLRADLRAILVELQLQMEEYEPKWVENDEQVVASCRTWEDLNGIIQNKINVL